MPPVADPVAPPKTNWADEDVDEGELPPPTETVGPDGIVTIVEWRLDEQDRKVKVTRKIRRKLQTQTVSHTVAERKHWAKFGAERGKPSGPDHATTTVGEDMAFKLSAGGFKAEPVEDEASKMKASLGTKKIMCRLCKGDHFTSKCPLKDTLEGAGLGDVLGEAAPADDFGMASGPAAGFGSTDASGKYVPPSMRAGARGAGESMFRARDDLPTLRITSLSTDADENDLRSLFERFGRVARANVVKDRETGESKGFGFVSFESRKDAEKALEKMNGRGYDNLILSVSWSQPREPRQN
jgi:translation initiation factor 3 subunit G